MINVRELSHCAMIDGPVIELLNLIFPIQGTMIIVISQDFGDMLMINGITRCFKGFRGGYRNYIFLLQRKDYSHLLKLAWCVEKRELNALRSLHDLCM